MSELLRISLNSDGEIAIDAPDDPVASAEVSGPTAAHGLLTPDQLRTILEVIPGDVRRNVKSIVRQQARAREQAKEAAEEEQRTARRAAKATADAIAAIDPEPDPPAEEEPT